MSKNKKSEAADKMELVDELVPGSSYQAKGEIINPLEDDDMVMVYFYKKSPKDPKAVQFYRGWVSLSKIGKKETLGSEDLAIVNIYNIEQEILDGIFNSKGYNNG